MYIKKERKITVKVDLKITENVKEMLWWYYGKGTSKDNDKVNGKVMLEAVLRLLSKVKD